MMGLHPEVKRFFSIFRTVLFWMLVIACAVWFMFFVGVVIHDMLGTTFASIYAGILIGALYLTILIWTTGP